MIVVRETVTVSRWLFGRKQMKSLGAMHGGRRPAAVSSGFLAALFLLAGATYSFAHKVVDVRMVATPEAVYFDPAGIHIEPGDTVRWIRVGGYHSTTAYHPSNSNHELRIPKQAKPWDSGVLTCTYPGPNSTFKHTFTVEGVYDYFCRPHEQAGMVGRIIVGKPLPGPGAEPFGYAPDKGWKPVPKPAREHFPSIEKIMSKGSVSP
jgi:plastocyanin